MKLGVKGGLGRGGVGSWRIGSGGALLARGSVTPGILRGLRLVLSRKKGGWKAYEGIKGGSEMGILRRGEARGVVIPNVARAERSTMD